MWAEDCTCAIGVAGEGVEAYLLLVQEVVGGKVISRVEVLGPSVVVQVVVAAVYVPVFASVVDT